MKFRIFAALAVALVIAARVLCQTPPPVKAPCPCAQTGQCQCQAGTCQCPACAQAAQLQAPPGVVVVYRPGWSPRPYYGPPYVYGPRVRWGVAIGVRLGGQR